MMLHLLIDVFPVRTKIPPLVYTIKRVVPEYDVDMCVMLVL